MKSSRISEDVRPLSDFRANAAVRDDILIAEEQVARGEGIEHEDAEQRLLARFRRLPADELRQDVQ